MMLEVEASVCPGLSDLMADPGVSEILVNGPSEIWAERNGSLALTPHAFSGEDALRRWVRGFLSERGRKVDHSSPFADCSLPDGSRVHVVGPPVSRRGLCLSIRKFPQAPWTLEALQRQGVFSAACVAYLKDSVRARRNIFLSGSTGSGKTSLLGALIGEVTEEERIVALEDIAEIKTTHPHFLSMEGRPANQEGEGRIELRRLLRESLRMRPDRLVVGECRGAEALDLLLALNTGHHGSMGTIHANSPRDALQRLETLALLAGENLGNQALQNLILGGVHIVAQLERRGGRRAVSSIVEVKGCDGGRFLLKEMNF
jgi:pilus assembly protein CpaF